MRRRGKENTLWVSEIDSPGCQEHSTCGVFCFTTNWTALWREVMKRTFCKWQKLINYGWELNQLQTICSSVLLEMANQFVMPQWSSSVSWCKTFFVSLFYVCFLQRCSCRRGRSESRFPESFVVNSLAASPVNGRDESDGANIRKWILGRGSVRAVVRQHSARER